jgi:hypothetical protein
MGKGGVRMLCGMLYISKSEEEIDLLININ